MSTYETPIPGASGYEQADLLAQRAYQNAMSRYAQQRSQSLLKYGYTRDAKGNLGVDPNNEYGQYQQMLKGDAAQSEGLERAQAGSGWGSSSGFQGAQREQLDAAHGGEQAALGQDLTNTLSDITQGEQEAGYTRDQALYQAQLEAAQNAINQGNFNPADFGGIDVPYGDQANSQGAEGSGGGGGARHNVHQRGRAQLVRRARQRARARGRGR